jgi:hypothetical protein
MGQSAIIKPSSVIKFKEHDIIGNKLERLAEMLPLFEGQLKWRI